MRVLTKNNSCMGTSVTLALAGPKNTYVKDTWWTSYNAQLIEDIAKNPSKYNVVILTNVANPNYIDELKVLGGTYEKEILELSKNFHFIAKDDFWTIKTK